MLTNKLPSSPGAPAVGARSGDYFAVQPPSTTIVWPVT